MTITLYNDDFFNVLPTLPKKSIDLVLVDLPYGCINSAWDIKIDLEKMWKELKG
jgi:site-specific DNA-methyltransferase (adenine-specific)